MRLVIILAIPFLLSACNDRSSSKAVAEKDTANAIAHTPSDIAVVDTATSPLTAIHLWRVNVDSNSKKRTPNFNEANLNVDSLIRGLNKLYPNVLLEKVKTSGDTVYTKIRDSEYLSESIGSSGPQFYFAEVVLNLTSVPNINFVKIDFEEGSHAVPGVWSAEEYSGYKEE